MNCKYCKFYKDGPPNSGGVNQGHCMHLSIIVTPLFGCMLFQALDRETIEEGTYQMMYHNLDDFGRLVRFVDNNAPERDKNLFHQAIQLLTHPTLYSFSIYASESILIYNYRMDQVKIRILDKPMKEGGPNGA